MTDQIKSNQDSRFKQVYVRENRAAPYTSAMIGHDDYLCTPIWRKLRDVRLRMDGYKCQKCGTGINLQVHHIRYPSAWGMENVETDLVTLCDACHAIVHSNDNNKGDY